MKPVPPTMSSGQQSTARGASLAAQARPGIAVGQPRQRLLVTDLGGGTDLGQRRVVDSGAPECTGGRGHIARTRHKRWSVQGRRLMFHVGHYQGGARLARCLDNDAAGDPPQLTGTIRFARSMRSFIASAWKSPVNRRKHLKDKGENKGARPGGSGRAPEVPFRGVEGSIAAPRPIRASADGF